MKLKLNKEYCRNHLFVTILMAGLGLYFAYDGFIGYPSYSDVELYEHIEKAKPEEGTDLKAFKEQKIKTQYGFAFMTLLASMVIGFRLYKSFKFDFSYDENSFSSDGKKYNYDDIVKVDDSLWEKKTITTISTSDKKIVLDGWHHVGVKEFHELLQAKNKIVKG